MASLDVFLPAIRRHINGPLEIMMRQSVLESAIAFCRESLFCREELTLLDATPGTTYALTENSLVKCVKRLHVIDLSEQLRRPDEPGAVLVAGIDFNVMSANHIAFVRPFEKVAVLFAVEPRRSVTEVSFLRAILMRPGLNRIRGWGTNRLSTLLTSGFAASMARQKSKFRLFSTRPTPRL
jgi:hypothetical protein